MSYTCIDNYINFWDALIHMHIAIIIGKYAIKVLLNISLKFKKWLGKSKKTRNLLAEVSKSHSSESWCQENSKSLKLWQLHVKYCSKINELTYETFYLAFTHNCFTGTNKTSFFFKEIFNFLSCSYVCTTHFITTAKNLNLLNWFFIEW